MHEQNPPKTFLPPANQRTVVAVVSKTLKFSMHFLFRSPHLRNLYPRHNYRAFSDSVPLIRCLKDRGLDHTVEREKNLVPLLNIKNLIKSEPSKSLPISIVAEKRDSLQIPIRPIDFIRKYPSIFNEFLPGGTGIHPHVKLTPEVLNLDSEEQLVYQSESYKQSLADRLLKLLMIARINRIPIRVLDVLKWELGLPENYVKKLVPEFPDYFRVIGGKQSGELELVCWSENLAVSVLEKKVMKGENFSKGMPIAFPMKFSQGMEIDKKAKKWMDECQKLPYISPYENAAHLSPSSDESDKWAAAILHEVLNLFVAKKVEKERLLFLAEHLDIRSRVKRVLTHHPGIFYMSSKLGVYTVVLREGYKRGLLIESNSLVKNRTQYIHLMHTVKDVKLVVVPGGKKPDKKEKAKGDEKQKAEGAEKEKAVGDEKEKAVGDVKEKAKGGEKEEKDAVLNDLSGSEIEDASDDDFEDEDDDSEDENDDEEEKEEESQRGRRGNFREGRERVNGKQILGSKDGSRRTEGKREIRNHCSRGKERMKGGEYENEGRGNARVGRGKPVTGNYFSSERGSRNADGERGMRNYGSRSRDRMGGEEYGNEDRRGARGNARERRRKTREGMFSSSERGSRNADGEREMRRQPRMTNGRSEEAKGQSGGYGNSRGKGAKTYNDKKTWGSKEGFRNSEGERETRRPRQDRSSSTNSRTEVCGGRSPRGSRERSSSSG